MGKAKEAGIIVGVIFAAFIIAVIVIGALSGEPERLPNVSAVFQQDPTQTRVGDLSFKVTNATQNTRVITVIVDVENHGSGIEVVSWLDFRLIDGEKQLYEDVRTFPPDSGALPAMGEIAPGATKAFKYVFAVPEGTNMVDCQLVVLEEFNNPRYLELTPLSQR